MNVIPLLIFGTSCYLLGNPKARGQVFSVAKKAAGMGIDALNRRGGEPVVATSDTVPTTEE